MKNYKITLAAFFVIVTGCPIVVSAHDQGGSLGTDSSATDYYQVSCFDDGSGIADQLFFEVRGESKSVASPVSAQIIKGDLSMSTTDNVDGDQTYSPGIAVVGGSGTYFVIVDKSGAGKVNYTFEYHCQTSTGVHTGTDIAMVQNQ